ncbi:hypothetical protein D4R78_07930 [bacterium]|nr:MAG: hypothetical protein D4R78_07930 [bacterium]
MKKNLFLILCLVAIAGCASLTAYYAPNRDLKNLGSMYVVHFPKDKRHLERIIADELTQRGYRATSGEEQDIPEGVNTLVTYIDHWTWDMSNYMLDIEIEFRNRQDKSLIASGKSYRPSLQRRGPDTMIKETLDKVLK